MFFMEYLPVVILAVVVGTIMVRKTRQDAREQAAASDAAGDVITRESVEWRPWRLLKADADTAPSVVPNEDDPDFMAKVSAVAARLRQERAQA